MTPTHLRAFATIEIHLRNSPGISGAAVSGRVIVWEVASRLKDSNPRDQGRIGTEIDWPNLDEE
jgi:hypothetical protein